MTVENTFHCKIWILRIQRPRELNGLMQCPYFVIQFTLSRAWILSRCTVLTNSVLLDRYSRIVYIYEIHDHIADSEFSRVFVLDALL